MKTPEELLMDKLMACDGVEELESLLLEHLGDVEEAKTLPKRITLTHKCALCSGERKESIIVRTSDGIESHSIHVAHCSLCDERLLEWDKEELVRMFMNLVRFDNPRVQQIEWLRTGGDVVSQMKEVGLVHSSQIKEGEGNVEER
jgi:hypothetical protein